MLRAIGTMVSMHGKFSNGPSRKSTGLSYLAIAAFAVASGGCAFVGDFHNYVNNGFKVGPQYLQPAAPVESDWIDAGNDKVSSDQPRLQDWWRVFDDPFMNSLVESAYLQNLPLREAGMRVLESRAQRGIAAGTLFPQQQEAFLDYRRRQISKTTIESRPLIAEQVPRAFDRWSFGLDAAWEVDLWGKFRRNLLSADALLDASIEEYDDILICLLAEAAATYVEMRTAQERLKYAEENVAAQKGLLDIAKSRYKVGDTDELDVLQAEINVKNTQSLIPEFETLDRKAQIRLSVLTGMPPRDLTPELGTGPIPTAPESIALGIPADLLRRRPDVRKAERDLAAQSEQIGVAAADLLPQLTIKGDIGYDARTLGDLFRSSSAAGVISPGFSWNILNYGRIKNNVILQDAKFQQQALHYQQTVLRANADVERGIVSFLQGQRRVAYLSDAVATSKEAIKIASDQYEDGQINFEELFTLQSVLVQEQDALAVARGEVARSLIAVYKALGGGWEIRLDHGGTLQSCSPDCVEPLAEEVEPPLPVPLNSELPAPSPQPVRGE